MADIINLAEEKQKIQNLFASSNEEEGPIKELKIAMSALMSDNEQLNEGLTPILTLLALPDEQFKLIAPLYLEELDKLESRPEQQMAIAQTFNAAGINIDEFTNGFQELMQGFETNLKDQISEYKIDFIKRMFAILYKSVVETQTIDKRFIAIPYTTCNEDAIEPTYAHITDAGMDVYSTEEVILAPGELKLISTGIKLEIPRGYAVLVQARSGLSSKTKLRLANSLGLIDADYRGEIKVILENIEPRIKDLELDENGKIKSILYGSSYTVEKGQKVAQLRLVEVPHAVLTKVNEVNETERGEGGFGSTGK